MNSIAIKYIEKCFGRGCLNVILSDYDVKLFKKNKHVDRVCLVPRDISSIISSDLNNVDVIGSGTIIGWIKRGVTFVPSVHLFNVVKEKGFNLGCSVIAKPQGVKAFLYGKDLLALSVEQFLHPIEKGMYVAVIDPEDMVVIGIGRLVIDPSELGILLNEGKVLVVAVENVFDLGVLLRNEKYI